MNNKFVMFFQLKVKDSKQGIFYVLVTNLLCQAVPKLHLLHKFLLLVAEAGVLLRTRALKRSNHT